MANRRAPVRRQEQPPVQVRVEPAINKSQEGARLAELVSAEGEARQRALRSEQERQKRIEDEKRAAADAAAREKARLEQLRRANEEKARLKREAFERQQVEEAKKVETLHAQMKEDKVRQLRAMAEERERHKHLDALRKEVDQQMAKAAPTKRAQQTSLKPQRFPPPKSAGAFDAAFTPEDVVDHLVLGEYSARAAPDPSLPRVVFTKRGDKYFIGQRRCNIKIDGSDVFVVVGPDRVEPFRTWIEEAERIEGLKLRGLSSSNVFLAFVAAQGRI